MIQMINTFENFIGKHPFNKEQYKELQTDKHSSVKIVLDISIFAISLSFIAFSKIGILINSPAISTFVKFMSG